MKSLAVVHLRHVGRGDIALVGFKAANLGEMIQAGLPVPAGFVVSCEAYEHVLKSAGIDRQIAKLLADITPDNSKKFHAVAKQAQKLILAAPLSKPLEDKITTAWKELTGNHRLAVAVRASLSADQAPDESFPGQEATYLDVVGAPAILRAVKNVWASFFDSHAIYARHSRGQDHFSFHLGVVVQLMVHSERAGTLCTINPVSGNTDEVVIEAAFGLGESVVLGSLTPDRYVVSKADAKVLETRVASQPWQLLSSVAKNAGPRHVAIPKTHQRQQKLATDEILALAALAGQAEDHYHHPQTIEWAIDQAGTLWLVDTFPLQVAERDDSGEATLVTRVSPHTVIIEGLGASVGVAAGPVRVIHRVSQIDDVRPGEIMVAEATTPAYLPAMKRAAAIITDTGGMTTHAVVIARELGIPCIVGAGSATSHLKNGVVVTVDGHAGKVYKGKVTLEQAITDVRPKGEIPITATKVYINLAEPEKAQEYAKLPVDGVGLLRAEFMMAGIGVHPRYLVKEKKEHLYVRKLVDGIKTIAEAFHPRPVIYRASDFKTNEYRSLTGGDKVEPREENPMLGYRGALRYVREPDLFKLELAALKTVRESYNLTNVSLMIPFVRTVAELEIIAGFVKEAGLQRDHDFKLWMMAEVPSNVLMLEDFLKVGIDGVSIGSNDLTQLILGVDRDNARLASAFDERHPAVVASMRHIVEICRKYHVSVSICGQAASTYPEITETLIAAGITSVSVNPDSAIGVRSIIASIERRLMLDALTRTAHGDAHPLWK